MDPLNELFTALQEWGGKTLAELRSEAEKQFNGTAFLAQQMNGRRVLLAYCATGEFELKRLGALFPDNHEPNSDWSKITLASMAVAAIKNGGVIHEPFRRADRSLAALTLIVADPDSIEKLAPALGLP